MKIVTIILWLPVLLVISGTRVAAQTDEAAQLLLNVEKLAQFRQILTDLKKGYEVVSKGYNTVKNISEGNFKLHKVFLDGLLEVSPAVRKYKRVADIIEGQIAMVREYKAANLRFHKTGRFTAGELGYINEVYGKLLKESLRNLDDLTTVVTANKMRMSDDERLKAIDQIYLEMEDKLSFLRVFNANAAVLAVQRAKAEREIKTSKNIYGIN